MMEKELTNTQLSAILCGDCPEEWAWIPNRIWGDFVDARNRLLGSHQMPLEKLREVVEDAIKVHAEDMNDPEYAVYERHLGREDKFVVMIARIVHSGGLGLENGLPLLTDDSTTMNVTLAINHRENQQKKARARRNEIQKIIRNLARSPSHENESAKELWPIFIGELDSRGFVPDEKTNPKTTASKWTDGLYVTYEEKNEKRKTMKASSFVTALSKHRK